MRGVAGYTILAEEGPSRPRIVAASRAGASMRRSKHQRRVRGAEDLFLKAMITVVVVVAVVGVAIAVLDDSSSPTPSANLPPGTSEPRTLERDPPLQLGPVPTSSTTGALPTTGPTPEQILAFTNAANLAKAKADAELAKFLLAVQAAKKPAPPAPSGTATPPATAPTTTRPPATTTTTVPVDTSTTTTTTVPDTTTTTTKHGRK
jgi:hypothetical protein